MTPRRTPWNKGKLVGQKAPLRLSEIWSMRVRLQRAGNVRDLALFNLAIDSKLRSCDLVALRYATSPTGTRSPSERSSSRKKRADRSSLS